MRSAFGRSTAVLVLVSLAAIAISGCVEINYHGSKSDDGQDAKPESGGIDADDTEPAPSYGLVSDSAQSSSSRWTVKVSSASRLVELSSLQFILSTPSSGTLVAAPDMASFTSGPSECWYLAGQVSSRKESKACTGGPEFRIRWIDINGDNRVSVGDIVAFDYEATPGQNAYNDPLPTGEYSLEILHEPSDASAGSLPRTF